MRVFPQSSLLCFGLTDSTKTSPEDRLLVGSSASADHTILTTRHSVCAACTVLPSCRTSSLITCIGSPIPTLSRHSLYNTGFPAFTFSVVQAHADRRKRHGGAPWRARLRVRGLSGPPSVFFAMNCRQPEASGVWMPRLRPPADAGVACCEAFFRRLGEAADAPGAC